MKTLRTTALIVVSALLVLGIAALSYAGDPLGRFCFNDSFGRPWVLNVGQFGSENFELHGYILTPFTCSGTNQQPLVGTASLQGNSISLGVHETSLDPTSCFWVSWKAQLSLSTLSGSGSWANQAGSTGTFGLSLASSCPVSGAVPAPQGGDPELVR